MPLQVGPLLTIISKGYYMSAVQTVQIHTWELNQGPWDLHSTLTTRLQQLVKVGCSNLTDTMLLLFCHPCSPAPPLLLGQLHWSLTIIQKSQIHIKLFLALAQYAGLILSWENVTKKCKKIARPSLQRGCITSCLHAESCWK